MIYCWADNILSPLGFTTAENYRAVKSGRSSLQRYDHRWPGAPPFTASLFTEEQQKSIEKTKELKGEQAALAEAFSYLPENLAGKAAVLHFLQVTHVRVAGRTLHPQCP